MGSSISDVARLTGLKASAIRFYEEEGLIKRVVGRVNGRRSFDRAAIAEISIIHDLRMAGMTLADIKTFQNMRAAPQATCKNLADIALERAASLRKQISTLRLAEERLRNYAKGCAGICGSALAGQCETLHKISGTA